MQYKCKCMILKLKQRIFTLKINYDFGYFFNTLPDPVPKTCDWSTIRQYTLITKCRLLAESTVSSSLELPTGRVRTRRSILVFCYNTEDQPS